MATNASSRLPVCRHDGHCYRKNPMHFQEYAHPQQYPNQRADGTFSPSTRGASQANKVAAMTVVDVDEEDKDSTTGQHSSLKRPRTDEAKKDEDHAGGQSSDAPSRTADVEASEVALPLLRETDSASPRQLLHFLTHAPHLSALIKTGSAAASQRTADGSAQHRTSMVLPLLGQASHWTGVADVLHAAYAGMRFHAADVQCVLTAACVVNSEHPCDAFPGWRLVGPFELAWRCSQPRSGEDEAPSLSWWQALVRGTNENPENEARLWRCGRYRYDPPECQTVCVETLPAESRSGQGPGLPGSLHDSNDGNGSKEPKRRVTKTPLLGSKHLCWHRDDPTEAPGLLVEGMAGNPKITMLNAHGWLSAYLCAWYAARGDAASAAIVQALENAWKTVRSDAKLLDCFALQKDFCKSVKEQQQSASAARRKTWVAPTFNGLGLVVPVNRQLDIGYREPNIPAHVSFANCLRDSENNFMASFRASSGSVADAAVIDVNPNARAVSQPPPPRPLNRSIHYDRLTEAKPFTAKTSEILDDIFVCADIANDEGDCGVSLELGLNCLASILADTCVEWYGNGGRKRSHDDPAPRVDPVLWQTYRLLDCAYMLLQRPLYRHILRCHLPMLADASHPVLFSLCE